MAEKCLRVENFQMYLHVRSHERATKKVKRSINEARGKGRRFSSLSAPPAFHPGKPGQPDGALRAAASSRAREALSTRSSTPTPVRLWSLKTAQLGTTTPQPRSPGQDRLVQKSSSSICLPALPSPATMPNPSFGLCSGYTACTSPYPRAVPACPCSAQPASPSPRAAAGPPALQSRDVPKHPGPPCYVKLPQLPARPRCCPATSKCCMSIYYGRFLEQGSHSNLLPALSNGQQKSIKGGSSWDLP